MFSDVDYAASLGVSIKGEPRIGRATPLDWRARERYLQGGAGIFSRPAASAFWQATAI